MRNYEFEENSFNEDDRVIILNKIFLGDWLNGEGNIGHEIIDFLLTDFNEHYIYNNPWGHCPNDIRVNGSKSLKRTAKEKYNAKYMVLTTNTNNKEFKILYVIELSEKIHRLSTSKNSNLFNANTIKKYIDEHNVIYNNKKLYEIYGDDGSLYLTFKARKIYKAIDENLSIETNYNYQRNKGYLYSDRDKMDFLKLNELIENSISNKKLVPFEPIKISDTNIHANYGNKTFLNLLSLENNEQVFTNMLQSLLSYKDLIKDFVLKFKNNDVIFNIHDNFKVYRESNVANGRMDICAIGNQQKIIIENKVFSGLNGKKPENNFTQLSTYFKWGKSEVKYSPICFITAPDFRINDIKNDILLNDKDMINIYKFIPYSSVASFIEELREKGKIDQSYEYYFLIDQIINSFYNLSYKNKEELYAKMFFDATK